MHVTQKRAFAQEQDTLQGIAKLRSTDIVVARCRAPVLHAGPSGSRVATRKEKAWSMVSFHFFY
jgi:hypothetical protein